MISGSPLENGEPEEVSAKQVLQICGLCCYTFCPPVPELVTRKLAFHPPTKGESYCLKLKDRTDEEIDSIKKVLGKEFSIELKDNKTNSRRQLDEVVETVEAFTVTTKYGNHLVGVKVSPSNSSSSRSLYTVRDQVLIFSQPNSSDVGQLLQPSSPIFQRLADSTGCDLYAFDYSGYGYSTGSPSEKNIYSDIEAIYNFVREKCTDKKIALVGFSIGTAATTWMAAQQPTGLSGVVLIAPFTSGLTLLRQSENPEEQCYLDRFRSVDRVEQIEVPVLLIHGTEDTVVPVEHSYAIHGKLKMPVHPLMVYGADHQTVLMLSSTNRRIWSFLLFETTVGGELEEFDVPKGT